jgi:hypothetical protein
MRQKVFNAVQVYITTASIALLMHVTSMQLELCENLEQGSQPRVAAMLERSQHLFKPKESLN